MVFCSFLVSRLGACEPIPVSFLPIFLGSHHPQPSSSPSLPTNSIPLLNLPSHPAGSLISTPFAAVSSTSHRPCSSLSFPPPPGDHFCSCTFVSFFHFSSTVLSFTRFENAKHHLHFHHTIHEPPTSHYHHYHHYNYLHIRLHCLVQFTAWSHFRQLG